MDRPLAPSGSVKRARERAQAGLPTKNRPSGRQQKTMEDGPTIDSRAPPRRVLAAPPPLNGSQSRLPRARATAGPDENNPNIGQTISRPSQAPQWPLPGPPIAATNQTESEPYRPPPGRPQQAPQRPPRPSQVPSLLEQSRLKDPTPVILNPQSIPETSQEYGPEYGHEYGPDYGHDYGQDYDGHDYGHGYGHDYVSEYGSSVPPTPSNRMTTSTVGSIPDFPVPVAPPTTAPPGPPRRSAILGPPPSSRRGASSFYSSASFVSPIPEERSAASRSHGSYASSAAMPADWPEASPQISPTFYDDTDTEKSRDSVYDEFSDESKLVRSASIGKRGKPALVTTKSSTSSDLSQRPAPSPVQPFNGGTGYVDASTNSSNTLPTFPLEKPPTVDNASNRLSPDAMLGAFAAASATDLAEPSQSPPEFTRLSAIRRPPKLDIDAVRSMEARGSITSLPDLIRRATKLASMIDRGKRPGSRFENFNDYLDEKSDARGGEKDLSDDRHRSGLSDMLAAFPPPGDRQSRGSWFRTTSWPLAPSRQGGATSRASRRGMTSLDDDGTKKSRRCCGLPIWAFLLAILVLICVIVAAVLVPLEFFVFKNLGNQSNSKSELAQCETSLTCQNGGTNVVIKGVCSCICTNGFTGSDCSVGGTDGCTTTNLISSDGADNINNVTLGKSIPRLIADGNTNFTIPLSGTAILAKFNTGDLSCIAQNSLVTFDGQSARVGEASSKVENVDESVKVAAFRARAAETGSILTVSSDAVATSLVLDPGTPSPVATTVDASHTAEPTATQTGGAATATSTSSATTSKPTAGFVVTEEAIDFARVVVLYILQEENSTSAETAQTKLQRFFSDASSNSGVSKTEAASVDVGGKNTVDVVSYSINIGAGAIGGKVNKRDILLPSMTWDNRRQVQHVARHGGSGLSKG
ncbi:hypothetical protein G7046_g2720 [Stylonectria norvegica]|nr:hypothetical protein G7046_g2720 [Stylonectria norvegica]